MESGIQSYRAIALNWIGVDFIFLDLVVPVIFYLKYDVETSVIIIFIGKSDVDNIDYVIL